MAGPLLVVSSTNFNRGRRRLSLLIVLVVLVPGFFWGARQEPPFARHDSARELQVSLPPLVLLAGTFGDRYLAANLSGFRTVVAAPERMSADEFAVLAQAQIDIAWLNPAHEDNYYIAAAILPWNGQLGAAQKVLASAAEGRPNDWWPLFYFGFNQAYLEGSPALGAVTLRRAAARARDPNERVTLEDIAARWYEKGLGRHAALSVLQTMAEQAQDRMFRRYLEQRLTALRLLLAIDEAAAAFKVTEGRMPRSVEELVGRKFLPKQPIDPFGRQFGLVNGTAVFLPQN